jgi:uncharacterized damage-inducible protein DinB
MSHILLGEQAWFDRVLGKEPNRNLVSGNLDRVVAYRRFTGEEYQSPVADILLHLTLHGAHHRGQMATYVSGKGMKPINADFIQYCLSNRL